MKDYIHLQINHPREVIKLFSCSAEQEIFLISTKVSRNSFFIGSDKPRILFFLPINAKMAAIVTTVGIYHLGAVKN